MSSAINSWKSCSGWLSCAEAYIKENGADKLKNCKLEDLNKSFVEKMNGFAAQNAGLYKRRTIIDTVHNICQRTGFRMSRETLNDHCSAPLQREQTNKALIAKVCQAPVPTISCMAKSITKVPTVSNDSMWVVIQEEPVIRKKQITTASQPLSQRTVKQVTEVPGLRGYLVETCNIYYFTCYSYYRTAKDLVHDLLRDPSISSNDFEEDCS